MLHFLFGFNGRIRRTNYFLGALVTGLIADAYWGSWAFHGYWGGDWGWRHGFDWDWIGWPIAPAFWAFGAVFALACVWARFALAAKRWHDVGATGWLSLLSLIPGVHFIIFILLCLLPPTRGPNQYGPDPRTGSAAYA